jgi:hypothetical protein
MKQNMTAKGTKASAEEKSNLNEEHNCNIHEEKYKDHGTIHDYKGNKASAKEQNESEKGTKRKILGTNI